MAKVMIRGDHNPLVQFTNHYPLRQMHSSNIFPHLILFSLASHQVFANSRNQYPPVTNGCIEDLSSPCKVLCLCNVH